MSFKNLVPMVAFWKSTGREERVTDICVTKVNDYCIMAVCEEYLGGYYMSPVGLSTVKVGDRFPTGKLVELRKHYYASYEDYNNNILTPGTETIIRIIPD